MGRLAKVMQGQSQPGLKVYKTGGAVKLTAKPKVDNKGCAPMACGGKAKKK